MSFWVYPITHDGSTVLLYMVTWIPSIYPLYDIYIAYMDPKLVLNRYLPVFEQV